MDLPDIEIHAFSNLVRSPVLRLIGAAALPLVHRRPDGSMLLFRPRQDLSAMASPWQHTPTMGWLCSRRRVFSALSFRAEDLLMNIA